VLSFPLIRKGFSPHFSKQRTSGAGRTRCVIIEAAIQLDLNTPEQALALVEKGTTLRE
jgi:hypothetical protein